MNGATISACAESRTSSGTVDISDLDKVEVLRALYANAKPLGRGYLTYIPGELSRHDAQEAIEETRGDIDYLKGRVIKVDLRTHNISTRLFNRDNGDDAAEKAIEALRLSSVKK